MITPTLDDLWTREAEALVLLNKVTSDQTVLEKKIDQMERSLAYMRHMDQQHEEEPEEGPGTYVLNDEGELVFLPD